MKPGDLTFAFEGKTWTARCDWEAIFFFEQKTGVSLVELFEGLTLGRPKLSHLAVFFQAVLQKSHAGVALDTCGAMAMDPALQASLFELAGTAMPQGEAAPGE